MIKKVVESRIEVKDSNFVYSKLKIRSLRYMLIMSLFGIGFPNTVMPNFAEVYSFIGSVFDPRTTGHVQRLKQMDPINLETVCHTLHLSTAQGTYLEYEMS